MNAKIEKNLEGMRAAKNAQIAAGTAKQSHIEAFEVLEKWVADNADATYDMFFSRVKKMMAELA